MGDERETAFSTDNKIVVKLLETANKHHRAGPVWRREKPPYEFTADALVKFWTATDIAKFAHEWPEHWELVQVMGKELGWKLPVVDAPVEKDDDSTVILDVDASILKADNEKRVAYGVVYPLMPAGWVDTQNDRASEAVIEKMAHDFMLKSRRYDIQHQRDALPTEAVVVESYLAPVDFEMNGHKITKGSWVVATHFPDVESWNLVKSKHLNAYSIRGRGKRTPILVNS
jgi:hypothetical protein